MIRQIRTLKEFEQVTGKTVGDKITYRLAQEKFQNITRTAVITEFAECPILSHSFIGFGTVKNSTQFLAEFAEFLNSNGEWIPLGVKYES